MNNNVLKLCAVGCCVLYILLFLFLPEFTVALIGIGVSGADMLQFSGWGWLVIISGVAMGACALLLPGKVAAIVSGIGAFMPLFSLLFLKSQITGLARGATGSIGAGVLGGTVDSIIGYAVQVGSGVILAIICGLGSAVLCFLSEGQSKATTRTAGLGSDTGDEW